MTTGCGYDDFPFDTDRPAMKIGGNEGESAVSLSKLTPTPPRALEPSLKSSDPHKRLDSDNTKQLSSTEDFCRLYRAVAHKSVSYDNPIVGVHYF